MAADYWSKTLRSRVSRRRALAGAGALAAGAAALSLVGCGGGEEGGGEKDTSGLLFKPVETTKNAVKGGTLQGFFAVEPLNYDPLSQSSQFVFFHAHHAYQRFVALKRGTVNEPATGEPEPDAATSWETTPDGLKLTMKLRPNNKFDPRPPTSSRVMTSADVKWSWERFTALQVGRQFFSNQLNADAPVKSMEFPDANTVVVNLAFPVSALLKMFGTIYYFAILPVEADGKFDIRQEMRGSGAWMMTKYERSIGQEYVRNPNWYRAGERPFLDGINYATIPDATQQQAQFKAKRLWSLIPNSDVVLSMKKELPDTRMIPTSPFRGQTTINYVGMSKLPDSKWEKDVRLRQALSMTIDRAAYIDAFFNVRGFESEGIPMEAGWNSHVPCSWPSIWLNPEKNELGENSKYLQLNLDEAAKLLRAAGAFGAEDTLTFAAQGLFGTAKQIEVLAQMFNQGGHFKIKLNPQDYTTVITPKYTFGHAQYPDLGTHPLGAWVDWDIPMWNTFSPSGRNDYVGHDTPELKELMVKHRQERDLKKRAEIAKDWQKAMAKHMVVIPFPGQATAFSLAWPWYGNAGYFEVAGGGVTYQETIIDAWYDKSKDTRTT